MQETLWEIACDQKGYMYSEMAIVPKKAAAVVVTWSETSEERRAKPSLAKEATGTRCG